MWSYAEKIDCIGENGTNPLEELAGRVVMEFLKIPAEKMDLTRAILEAVQWEWERSKGA